jgi:hypothetical protein
MAVYFELELLKTEFPLPEVNKSGTDNFTLLLSYLAGDFDLPIPKKRGMLEQTISGVSRIGARNEGYLM